MEQNDNNLNENSNFSEKQKELSIKSYDDFILSLESTSVPLEHIHMLIDKITQDDPKIKESFENFQEDMFQYVVNRFKELQKEADLDLEHITTSQSEVLLKSGENEIKQKQEILYNNLIKISLLKDILGMYKDYLESILNDIRFKFLSNKDLRYNDAIKNITDELNNLNNITNCLNEIKNYDDVINFDFKSVVDKTIVSEENIAQTGNFDQPVNALWDNNSTTSYVNEGYNKIKDLILNSSPENTKQTKIDIYKKIREFDSNGLDDDKHIYNSGDAIQPRITQDILNNENLNKNKDISLVFSKLKNFNDAQKQEFSMSLKGGKQSFMAYLEDTKILDNLGLKPEDKNDFIDNLYINIKQNYEDISQIETKEKITKTIKSEITSQFDYMIKKSPESKKKELEDSKNNALNDDKINELYEKYGDELAFSIFQRTLISQTLENNSLFVQEVSKKDDVVGLYSNIEGIGDNISDKNFNVTSKWTQILLEQIVIMYVSGFIGNFVLKGMSYEEVIANMSTKGINFEDSVNITSALAYESSIVYLAYAGLNGLANKDKAIEAFSDLNYYDFFRNIVFLGLLKNIPIDKLKNGLTAKNGVLNDIKNISVDTGSLLGTEIAVRLSLGETLKKEGIPRDVDGNITLDSTIDFLADELKFIIPFVIGLRKADATVNELFKNGNKPKIDIELNQDNYVLKIEGLKKEIRILRQNRNIARNKQKDTKEIDENLGLKKDEYKKLRDTKTEEKIENNTIENVLPPTEKHKKSNENKGKDNVNTNTGNKTIQEFLNGKNIEDVMSGFDLGKGLNKKFEDLINKGVSKEESQKLISDEIDARVNYLKKHGVVVDKIEGEKFIKDFKEQRFAEFDKLIELIGNGKDISGKIEMKLEGYKPWKLEIKNVRVMSEFFGKYIDIQEKQGKNKNNESNI